MNKPSSFVPNSFQTPNGYVDHVMPYLTGEEYKVLIYATRRILGFQKRQDRISLSQFTKGTKRKNGNILDRGTGLSVETVKTCLSTLVDFGLMIRTAENDPKKNEGTLWSLQWNGLKVNWLGLEKRAATKAVANSGKMLKVRSMRHTPPNGIEGGAINGIEGPPHNGIETQYPVETQGKPVNDEDDAKSIEARTSTIKELYEQNIGAATPLLMNMFRNAAITYPADWYKPAFEATVKSAKHRSWSFTETVLQGWRDNGFGWKPGNQVRSNGNSKQPAADRQDIARKVAQNVFGSH